MGNQIMTNPTITIHDLETGEVVTRDLNAEELEAYEADKANATARAEAIESKAESKAALLDRLGITADEAALLLG
jgi:hypothetical protein